MGYTKSEVMQYVEENDVKFIKLFFSDICGNLKSLSIQPSILRKAFEEGIAFDGSAVKGLSTADKSDLFLIPDPDTLKVLPWRPQQGRVIRLFCNIYKSDGSVFEADFRRILQNAAGKAQKMGYNVQVGTECEFYLCKLDAQGTPLRTPLDMACYCDLAPMDKCENIRRDIVLNLEQMGLEPLTSHHESGPGQNEVDFKYDTAIKAADNYFTFRNTVKNIASRDGTYATFNPKPFHNEAGNGLHINMSLTKDGKNIFETECKEKEWFVQGIIDRIREITAFLNTTPESYHRLGKFESPKYVSWSAQNRSQLIRIPAAKGEERRFELRSPDPVCNLYIALSLIIHAGLEGIENKSELQPPLDINLLDASPDELKNIPMLPATLGEALELAKKSDFVKNILGQTVLDSFIKSREEDIQCYIDSSQIQAPDEAKFKRWIMF